MTAQAQGLLSNIKALAGSHPIGLGIIIGVGTYYVVNKYWLNEDDEDDKESESEKVTAS